MSVPEHEQGGDPACWAHLFEDGASGPVFADPDRTAGVGGAVWSLPHGGDLDANLVRIAPDAGIDQHVNEEVDVLLVVRSGDGELTVDGAVHMLAESAVALVPKGSSRAIRAGARGLAYLSVHQRRAPLGVRPASQR